MLNGDGYASNQFRHGATVQAWRPQSISATAIEVKLLAWENIIHT